MLLDHNVNRRFRDHLPGHEIKTTREMRWEQLSNGSLMASAANAGFEALIALDKKLEYEQNLKSLPLAVIVLDAPGSSMGMLNGFAPHVLRLLLTPLRKQLYVVEASGLVVEVLTPRPKHS